LGRRFAALAILSASSAHPDTLKDFILVDPEHLSSTEKLMAGIAACTRYAFSLLNFALPMHPARLPGCDNLPHATICHIDLWI
jgi:hypothetical protein